MNKLNEWKNKVSEYYTQKIINKFHKKLNKTIFIQTSITFVAIIILNLIDFRYLIKFGDTSVELLLFKFFMSIFSGSAIIYYIISILFYFHYFINKKSYFLDVNKKISNNKLTEEYIYDHSNLFMLLLGGTNSVINHAVYNSNILNLTKSEVEDLVKLLNKDEQEKFKVYLMSLNKEQVFNCNSILTFVNETINQQQENEKNQLFDKVIQNQEKELEVNNLNL